MFIVRQQVLKSDISGELHFLEKVLANIGGALVAFWVINVDLSPQVNEWEVPPSLGRFLGSWPRNGSLRGDNTLTILPLSPQHHGSLSGSD